MPCIALLSAYFTRIGEAQFPKTHHKSKHLLTKAFVPGVTQEVIEGKTIDGVPVTLHLLKLLLSARVMYRASAKQKLA